MNWENVLYDSFAVPVFKLQAGVEKLVKYGMATFMQYAEESGLSYCDINRVISKARIAYGKTDLKEFPCPPELYQKRLNQYTKNYRFSVKEAQGIIKRMDSYYHGGQQIPETGVHDVSTLTRGIG